MHPQYTPEQTARFWSRVDRSGDCWLWTGARHPFGYGMVVLGRRWYAHRLAWTLSNGPIPAGMCVLHRCDNPPCVNPTHLFLGTFRDNTADMHAKGRGIVGDQHPARTRGDYLPRGDKHPARLRGDYLPRGEAHVNAKLTADGVREIRRLLTEGGLSQKRIAERFGVTQSVIGRIAAGKSWRHV
jgi:hypothetical protein